MLVVHIMPSMLTHLATNRRMALCLAQFVLSDDEYAEQYEKYASTSRNWLIMDNGLAEDGKPLNPDALLEAAKRVHPQEIVLPDYIDPEKNVSAASLTLQHEAFMQYVNMRSVHLMYVPHGSNLWEWFENLRVVTKFGRLPDSIGISKFHDRIHPQSEVYGRGPLGMIARAIFPDKPIHYLGLGLPPSELQFLPYGRSCDTASAALYAYAGIKLSPEGALFRGDRITYKHDAIFKMRDEAIVLHNMSVMDAIAERQEHTSLWLNG